MRKAILAVVAVVALVAFGTHVFGAIELQKAKSGGHALGIRLGMTADELDALYTWRISKVEKFRFALLDFDGAICYISTGIEIVKQFRVVIYTDNTNQLSKAKQLIPQNARQAILPGFYSLDGVSYSTGLKPEDNGNAYVVVISFDEK